MKDSSLAMEITSDYKKANKRMFIIIIILLIMLSIAVGYIIYLHNDIGIIEEDIREQEIDTSSIEYSDIINGDYYGED